MMKVQGAMDLDDLKEKWAEQDRKLDISIRLNQQILAATKLNGARSALQRLMVGLALEAVVQLAPVVALGRFIYDNRAELRFAGPAVALDFFAIAIFASLIAQIALTAQLDYGKPIAAIQKQLEEIRKVRIYYLQGIFLLATLAWTPLMIVMLKGFLRVDAYRLLGNGYLVASLLVGLLAIPVGLWLGRKTEQHLGASPFLQRLMRDLTGVNLNAAADFLKTVAEFETEK